MFTRGGVRRAGLVAALLLAAVAAGCAALSGGPAAPPPPGLDLVAVAGGTFLQGSDAPYAIDKERPAHRVTVSDFRIGRREVTVAEFRRFVEATGYLTETERSGGAIDTDPAMTTLTRTRGVTWRTPGYEAGDDDPVTWVTWNDAKAYTAWLAAATGQPVRLPREAEWEFAARERGRDLRWAGTDDPGELAAYAWYDATSGGRPHPVGTLKPNALGLHDMSGNVWEWCEDGYAPYAAAGETLVDPAGIPDATFRTLRGGSWRVGAEVARTSYRNGYRADFAHSSFGFRLAMDDRR
jgi:formylglycine-generating enzyme required for sulfatase activity